MQINPVTIALFIVCLVLFISFKVIGYIISRRRVAQQIVKDAAASAEESEKTND